MVQHHPDECYFCHRTSMSEARYAGICIRHQLLISLRLLILAFARERRVSSLWQMVRWWK